MTRISRFTEYPGLSENSRLQGNPGLPIILGLLGVPAATGNSAYQEFLVYRETRDRDVKLSYPGPGFFSKSRPGTGVHGVPGRSLVDGISR